MSDVITGPGFYRQRNGGKAEIVAVTRGVGIGYGPTDEAWEPDTWQLDGGWYEDSDKEHRFDIIGPWDEPPAKPFRISDHGPGVYETRDGKEATVSAKDGPGTHPWSGKVQFVDARLSWRDDGTWRADKNITSIFDLVRYLRPLPAEQPEAIAKPEPHIHLTESRPIPNSAIVPGEGWRLLGDEEIPNPDDWHTYEECPPDSWISFHVGSFNGKSVRELRATFYQGIVFRRRVVHQWTPIDERISLQKWTCGDKSEWRVIEETP